jgi:predicted negative regulator of RcsB-dependent stress response
MNPVVYDTRTGRDAEGRFVDVWTRTSPHHRRQAVLMIVVLSLLFAGLCCFTFWLRTGVYWPWLHDDYAHLMRQSFSPTGRDQVTLSDFLTYPISVERVPSHAVTLGLLFATLSSIPILVAILYRLPFSVILCAMVTFLAALPWLGLTILLGCTIATVRPFRFNFRYASALLGLVPVAVYFVMASREPPGLEATDMLNKALKYAPWFLSLLGSCVICALALGIARLIGYRPGGIPPLLAVLFVVPVALFHTKVGRDELEYHLLEHAIGPGSKEVFVAMRVGAAADREATRLWSESKDQSYERIRLACIEWAIDRTYEQTEADRVHAVEQCTAFIDHFRDSRYVPSVLFLQGRALDQRVRRDRLEQDYRAEFESDIPSPRSRVAWQTLAKNFPDDALSSIAQHRLAILLARDGQIDAAIELLAGVTRSVDGVASGGDSPGGKSVPAASVFSKAPPSASLGIDRNALVAQARQLHEMLVACRDDEPCRRSALLGPQAEDPDALVHPVQYLLCLYDDDPHYSANLGQIVETFPRSQTAGFAEVRQAMLIPSLSRRIERFRTIAQELSGRPAGALALFQLAGALQDDSIIDEAKVVLEDLVKRYPSSGWSLEARERLASVTMVESGGA